LRYSPRVDPVRFLPHHLPKAKSRARDWHTFLPLHSRKQGLLVPTLLVLAADRKSAGRATRALSTVVKCETSIQIVGRIREPGSASLLPVLSLTLASHPL